MYAANTNRPLSALASLAIVVGIAAALQFGLKPHWQEAVRTALVAVDLANPPPPPKEHPKPPPPEPKAGGAKGDPGARNLKNKATPVFAPPVKPPLVLPPPIAAAPLPNVGAAANTGASTLPGPGQGAGGAGNGLGGGGNGGTGAGAGGIGIEARQIRGHLSYGDLPQGLLADGQETSVEVRYTVNVDGSVSNCRIVGSSGFPTLDATACRLIEQRFRFKPALDRAGRPVPQTFEENHAWVAREKD